MNVDFAPTLKGEQLADDRNVATGAGLPKSNLRPNSIACMYVHSPVTVQSEQCAQQGVIVAAARHNESGRSVSSCQRAHNDIWLFKYPLQHIL